MSPVTGPNVRPITLADLPAISTRRWFPRQKAAVVAAVEYGLITLDEACVRYALSKEEFFSWQSAMHDKGVAGLRVIELVWRRNQLKSTSASSLGLRETKRPSARRR
jgi:hypothetical protein